MILSYQKPSLRTVTSTYLYIIYNRESIRTIEKHLLIQLIKEVAPLQDQHQIFTCVLLQYFTRADWNPNEWQELQFILEQNNIKWDGNTQVK